ncbi:hypothetical protein FO615_10535 [Riemerella anatipestifer]|nr:hypothetical protein [Riemerella anatipestifer]MDD1553997.1 hypothetical protein [Riemerella anatipestifer]MDD1596884.1 hypothetical protein [Riemerella anatipestifer]MSN83474.1 hypothetical protein [Riemerella anatipestifer]QDE20811.1 hypothetical protein FIP52_03065 [Riemerella anatipestifer]
MQTYPCGTLCHRDKSEEWAFAAFQRLGKQSPVGLTCVRGWRAVPSGVAARLSPSGGVLRLPASGNRNANNAAFNNQSSNGWLWSSEQNNSNNSWNLWFNSGNSNASNNNNRANGFSVRCLKD